MKRNQIKLDIEKPRRQAQGERSTDVTKRSQRHKPTQQKKIRQQIKTEIEDVESKVVLLSPSISNTSSKEVPQSFPRLIDSLKWTQTDDSNFATEQPCFQNEHNSTPVLGRKRKRSHDIEDLNLRAYDESAEKRARIPSHKDAVSKISPEDQPIEYWSKTGNWPKELFNPDPNMSQELARKRSSSKSYAQSVKEGQNPPAHTPEYERDVLAPAGIILDPQLGDIAISDDCKQLCTILVDADYEPPKYSLFQDDLFWKILSSVRSRNEPRVVRDISPLIVPSAELLFMLGDLKTDYLIEEIQTEWSRCVPLAGPKPKPDFAVGLRSSVFTDYEIEKLKYYNSVEKPTSFTTALYFPFLVCEVKCGEAGLNIADRQNARSASTAVHAILQLHQQKEIMELHRKILVFSISHDHTMVKIYGHYALTDKAQITFHRHLIHTFDLTGYDGKNRWTAYKFVRKLYEHFGPIHMKRIQDAISLLAGPKPESIMSITSTEAESDMPSSQEMGPPSQGGLGLKKRKLTKKEASEEKLMAQLEQLMAQLERQRQESERQRQESERQRQESERQRQESEQQRKELMTQLEQQRQESEQQRQESEQQRKDLMQIIKEQSEQLKELVRNR